MKFLICLFVAKDVEILIDLFCSIDFIYFDKISIENEGVVLKWVRGLTVTNVGFEFRDRSLISIVCQITDDGHRKSSAYYHSLDGGLLLRYLGGLHQ